MTSSTDLGLLFDDESWTSTSVFVKALTKNDDSGRHGILVPREAYPLFPALEGVEGENRSRSISVSWNTSGAWLEAPSYFRQYDRYPERRLTSLEPATVNRSGDRMFAIASAGNKEMFRAIVLLPEESGYSALLAATGGFAFVSGASSVTELSATPPKDSQFQELFGRLKEVNKKGWIPTVKAADGGVGMTLEHSLGIKANSSTSPDILNIELKASRKKKGAGKVTLFAKTPIWGSGGRNALLDEHGYHDDKRDRWALYHSINGHIESTSGWRLRVDQTGGKVHVDRHGQSVVDWEIATLDESLKKKHRETIFVEAETRGKGAAEEFRFTRITHAASPDITRFLSLIEDGRICQDFAMHRTETGSARDHGFLFRIIDGYQSSLFAYIRNYDLSAEQ